MLVSCVCADFVGCPVCVLAIASAGGVKNQPVSDKVGGYGSSKFSFHVEVQGNRALKKWNFRLFFFFFRWVDSVASESWCVKVTILFKIITRIKYLF